MSFCADATLQNLSCTVCWCIDLDSDMIALQHSPCGSSALVSRLMKYLNTNTTPTDANPVKGRDDLNSSASELKVRTQVFQVINQTPSQHTNQPTNQPAINQPGTRSASQPTNQRVSQPASQPTNQQTNKQINQTTSLPASQPTN